MNDGKPLFNGRTLHLQEGQHVVLERNIIGPLLRKRYVVRSLSQKREAAIATAYDWSRPPNEPQEAKWADAYRLSTSYGRIVAKAIDDPEAMMWLEAYAPLTETDGLGGGNRVSGFVNRTDDREANDQYRFGFTMYGATRTVSGRFRLAEIDGTPTILLDIDPRDDASEIRILHNGRSTDGTRTQDETLRADHDEHVRRAEGTKES